ncbi:MAG: YaeQ family protein [Halioglobus sp.]
MALKSTVYKAALNVADLDRNVYADFSLTLARHPSETEQRMMLRLIAFALHADEALLFGKGISTDDEPDLWQKSLSGEIELWIELGTPEPDRIKKACGRSSEVVVYAYGDRSVPVWWAKHAGVLGRLKNLKVMQLPDTQCHSLAVLIAPSMSLQCTLDAGEAWVSAGDSSVQITPQQLAVPG